MSDPSPPERPSERDRPSQTFSIEIHGDVTGGQVAGGERVEQHQTVIQTLSPEERTQLRDLLEELRSQVAAEAPGEEKQEALDQVEDLERTLTEDEQPDPGVIARVRKWFLDHLPKMAGAVTAVVVNPVVGKLVEAGGTMLAAEFTEWIRGDAPPADPAAPKGG